MKSPYFLAKTSPYIALERSTLRSLMYPKCTHNLFLRECARSIVINIQQPLCYLSKDEVHAIDPTRLLHEARGLQSLPKTSRTIYIILTASIA